MAHQVEVMIETRGGGKLDLSRAVQRKRGLCEHVQVAFQSCVFCSGLGASLLPLLSCSAPLSPAVVHLRSASALHLTWTLQHYQ